MSSVGPQLPAHLAKRKRSIDDNAEDSSSPPHKIQAASAHQEKEKRILGPAPPPTTSNPDALDIDSDPEEDYGPSVPSKPSATSPPKRVVGPSLPPTKNPDELDVDGDSSDDGYGPALSNPKPTTSKSSSTPPKRRVLGPAPPPAPLSEMPSHSANADESSDSDSEDDYGPSLPPAPGSAAAAKLQYEQEQEQQQERLQASQPTKPQRDEWMILPPTDSDRSSRVDPTNLKNRKFASGKSAKSAAAAAGGISSMWTETPEEKRKRLEDEVLGRVEPSLNSTGGAKTGRMESKEDEETARRIREYNERNRGKSLADQRQKDGGQKEEEDDPSKRGFDREKDMALGGRVGHVQKREMLAKASDFGSRFQKGRYL
ncbi:Uncharacterized protein BP5553_02511 [Venustampulla echinocandica]|uniref:DUF3752 domain-containing protein n=1 Tax=Venustampulla echinocandica TaxID=2656787 RepID=A0A370U431_9HELO|nr:Uncharacterized protein BP5553_02511 [Venustampulla echinocandica]RDL42532.1 Uncharacterized protein BP5553_02511 [Venustampulla echinocandica]